MRPASDTVSAFFGCLFAQEWAYAVSLLEPQAVEKWREGFLTNGYGSLNLGSDAERSARPAVLQRLAAANAPAQLGVATVEELFELPGAVLLERLLASLYRNDGGSVRLPWNTTTVTILAEREVLEDVAEVAYAFLGPSEEEMLEISGHRRLTWKVRLRASGGHWRMEIPDAMAPYF